MNSESNRAPNGSALRAATPNSALWNRGFLIIILVSCLINFGNFFVGNAFSYWIIDIGGTNATFGLIHGLYSALCLVARIFTGWLADNSNRRVTFLASCAVFIGSIIMMLISPFLGLFIAMRLLSGFGIGSATTVVTACSYDEIPDEKMDKGIGYIALFSSLITALTPVLSISAYNSHGPKSLVLISSIAIVVGVAVSYLVTFRMPNPETKKKLSLKNVFDPKQLFDVRCLKPAIPMALSVHVGMGVRSFVTLYGRSLGFANPGWFSTVSAVGLIFVRLALDRFKNDDPAPSKRIYFAYGMFIVFLFCIAFCKNLFMFYAAALIWSVAYGILMPSFTGMIVRAVPESRRGVAASMTGICGDVGMVVGSTVGGYIADAWGYPAMYLSVLVPVVLCCIYYRVNLDGKYKPYDTAADGNDPQIGGGGS